MAVLARDGPLSLAASLAFDTSPWGLLGVESGTQVRAGAMEAGLHRAAAEAEGRAAAAPERPWTSRRTRTARWTGKRAAILDDALQSERIVDAIAALSPDQRAVLVLRDIQGLSGAATAQALGLSRSAMKSRLHRARTDLRARLDAEQAAGEVRKQREATNDSDPVARENRHV